VDIVGCEFLSWIPVLFLMDLTPSCLCGSSGRRRRIGRRTDWWRRTDWATDDRRRDILSPQFDVPATSPLDLDKHLHFLITLGGLVIQHEHLFQLILPSSTEQSLKDKGKHVAEEFNIKHFQQWRVEVKKHSWWPKSKEQTANKLTELVMNHRMQ